MEYIIISLLTISLVTYIVYIVANRFLAIQMPVKYLILCAGCALLISLILPRILVEFTGLTGTLSIVTIFAIISSYFIAHDYDNAMQEASLKNTLATNSIEVQETLQKGSNEAIQLIPNLNEILQTDNAENIIEISENKEVITESTESSSTKSIDRKYFYPIKYEERDRISVALESNNNIQQNNSEIVIHNAIKTAANVAKAFTIPILFKQKIDIISSPLMLEAIHKHLDTAITNKPSIHCEENIDPKTIAKDSYPASNDLDILMDFAFLQKEQQNFLQALSYFSKALALYPNSEVSPLLVLEIGTILKNLGSYNEAIEVFSKGRLLPGVINNTMLEQELINNIAYLQIVNTILIQNSLEFMPFHCIPENVCNEIDSKFCEWRNQS